MVLANQLATYVIDQQSLVSFWLRAPSDAATYRDVAFVALTLEADGERLAMLLDSWSAEYLHDRHTRFRVLPNAEGQTVVRDVTVGARRRTTEPAPAYGALADESFADFLRRKQAPDARPTP